MDWLPRRKGFNVLTWRPSCQCKHMHVDHNPVAPFKCRSCACFGFNSDFACISCDQKFEEHSTLYETEAERKTMKKPVRGDFLPLAADPEVQDVTMKQLKVGPYAVAAASGIDGEMGMLSLQGVEEEKKEGMVVIQIQEDGEGGVAQRPGVTLMIDTR